MDGIKEIVRQLELLNEKNFLAEDFEYLKPENFPQEYRNLVDKINDSISLGNIRSKKERAFLDMVNGIIGSGMWNMEFDEKGIMTRVIWSDEYRKMLGFDNENEFPNMLESWSDRLHPDDKERTLKTYFDAIAGKAEYDVEYRLLTKNRGYKWFHSTGELKRRDDGTPRLFAGIFVDITHKREHEYLIKENIAAQNNLNDLRNELQSSNDILTGLCSDYVSVYLVNTRTGIYDIFKITGRLRRMVNDMARSNNDFDRTLRQYVDSYVDENHKKYVWEMSNLSHIKEALKDEKSYAIRYRVRPNPENVENFEIYFASSGEDTVTVAFRNIDNIVRQEAAYKMETQQDIAETLDGARTGIWTIEMEEDCPPRMYADRTMLKLIASDESATPEQHYTDWFSRVDPDYVKMVYQVIDEILKTGRAEVTYPWYHPVTGKTYVRCGGIPDSKFKKKGFAIKGYHQDITETMELKEKQEKALMEALIEAKRASQIKTEFLSHMSHDIRTPINGILGMLTIAEDNEGNIEYQKECHRKIRTAAEHLMSLINDVLDISKLESGAFTFANEPFEIHEVLESCNNIFSSQAEEVGVFLEMKYENITHQKLIGSALHIRQILINIISNAVKYNKPSGKVFVTTAELPQTDDKTKAVFRFTVKDTGIGMSEEFQKHLYEPFTQENSDARTHYKGTGLGMSITKKLVEQMNGTITAVSTLGEGSEFTVILPLEINTSDSEPSVKSEAEQPADISGMRILLVDDNDMNLEIAEYMLKSAGADVVTADNGEKALSVFSDSEPGEFDCILMDIMMPVMDGLEATRRIRRLDRPDAAEIPVIALSANAFVEDEEKARNAGMSASLAKPLDVKKLLRMIASQRKQQ